MFNLQKIREKKGISINGLARMSSVNASYISSLERGEKQNPTVTTLKKLAEALEVTIDDLIRDEKHNESLHEVAATTFERFNSVDEAIEFIKKPGMAAYGGYNLEKMTNEEIITFANELLNQLKLLGYKYNN